MHGRADFQNPENSGEICLTHQTLFLNEEALKNLSLSRNRNSKPEKKKAERCIHPASIQKMVARTRIELVTQGFSVLCSTY